MLRRLLMMLVLIGVFGIPSSILAGADDFLIPETTAARHGLTRPWFAQMELGQEKAHIQYFFIYDGVVYIQTDTSVVQAVDGETGKTYWAKKIGRSRVQSLNIGTNQNLLVLVNGSRMYALNRHNGNLLYEQDTKGAPGAGIAVSAKRVYVPMINGMIEAYRLDQVMEFKPDPNIMKKAEMAEAGDSAKTGLTDLEKKEVATPPMIRLQKEHAMPLTCQSLGQVLVPPLVTRETTEEEYAAWCTDRGYLNIGWISRGSEDAFSLKYRLGTESTIVCSPAYLPADPAVVGDSGVIYVATHNGFVHAVLEKKGTSLWRFPTGETIVQSPVVIRDRVYVTTQLGGMYCLNAKTGENLWWTPNLLQFAAASKSRVYAIDRLHNIVVLNAKNGGRIDSIPLDPSVMVYSNNKNDRIVLAEPYHRTIQCLHEIEQTEPIVYLEDGKQSDEAAANDEKGDEAGK
jgi:outer membrane protein assembly factor BamB